MQKTKKQNKVTLKGPQILAVAFSYIIKIFIMYFQQCLVATVIFADFTAATKVAYIFF